VIVDRSLLLIEGRIGGSLTQWAALVRAAECNFLVCKQGSAIRGKRSFSHRRQYLCAPCPLLGHPGMASKPTRGALCRYGPCATSRCIWFRCRRGRHLHQQRIAVALLETERRAQLAGHANGHMIVRAGQDRGVSLRAIAGTVRCDKRDSSGCGYRGRRRRFRRNRCAPIACMTWIEGSYGTAATRNPKLSARIDGS